jgi:hypothetical protein
MIIKRIWAEHVLKYAELDLNHLPSEGIIAISGQNEAGKSTIGEIVCFALFGRTFSLAPDEIVKVIRWSEPRCAAAVEFTLDGEEYEISRFLDDSGTQGARLAKQGVAEPLARGVEAVRDALAELLGFGFEEFVESFYLAQREITTPHPHSSAVKRMAGIAALERVAVVAEIEIEHEHTSIAETNTQIAECESRLTELALDEERLPQLEAARHKLVTTNEQAAAQVAELETRIAAYQETATQVAAAIEPMQEVAFNTSFADWKTCVRRCDRALVEIASRHQNDDVLALDDLQASLQGAQDYLDGFEQLDDPVGTYRAHLASQLGEQTGREGQGQNGPTLAEQQATCMRAHERTKRRQGKMRTGSILLLVLALIGWLALLLVNFGPEQGVLMWLVGAVAALCTVGAVFCGVRCRSLKTQATQLVYSARTIEDQTSAARREAQTLDTIEAIPLPRAVEALGRLPDSRIKERVSRLQAGAGAAFLDAAGLDAFQETLRNQAEAQETRLHDACTLTADSVSTLQAEMTDRETELQALATSLEHERERWNTYNALQTQLAGHHDQIAVYNRRIAARQLACDLLTGGCHHIAKTFNRDIRGLVTRTLPLLTEGRYEHLKIDENLDVQVFSREKQDFMYFEEISSGTQRQIMLALRLALSQEFINTTLGRRQFLFLDEPFAFFDNPRTRAALNVLPDLSDEMCQIWIVAQSFPDDFTLHTHIKCEKEQDRLVFAGV